jgi:hypothetical protein
MSALSELKCLIIESQKKAKMPNESSALSGELKICELLLNADYLSYNDGSFITSLGRLKNHIMCPVNMLIIQRSYFLRKNQI